MWYGILILLLQWGFDQLRIFAPARQGLQSYTGHYRQQGRIRQAEKVLCSNMGRLPEWTQAPIGKVHEEVGNGRQYHARATPTLSAAGTICLLSIKALCNATDSWEG